MRLLTFPLIMALLASTVFARLGDTQDMAEARYGLPKKQAPGASTLLEGATELVFEFDGWRLRCALLLASDGRKYVVRQQYAKIWNSDVMKAGGTIAIHDFECDAVLRGEAGAGTWKPRLLGAESRDLSSTVAKQFAHLIGMSGKVWVRDDGASAHALFGGGPIVFDLPQVRKYEAELKAIKERKARASVPKF